MVRIGRGVVDRIVRVGLDEERVREYIGEEADFASRKDDLELAGDELAPKGPSYVTGLLGRPSSSHAL